MGSPGAAITAVIPVMGHHFVARVIEWYAAIGIPALVTDGTPEPYEGQLATGQRYVHAPGVDVLDRLIAAIGEVQTPLAAFAPDDDFLLPGALQVGAGMLEDGRVACVVGPTIEFDEAWNGRFGQAPTNEWLREHAAPDAAARMEGYFRSYVPLTSALYRTAEMHDIFRKIGDAGFTNANYAELGIGGLACAAGEVRRTRRAWWARRVNVARPRHHTPTAADGVSGGDLGPNAGDAKRFSDLFDARVGSGVGRRCLLAYEEFDRQLGMRPRSLLTRVRGRAMRPVRLRVLLSRDERRLLEAALGPSRV